MKTSLISIICALMICTASGSASCAQGQVQNNGAIAPITSQYDRLDHLFEQEMAMQNIPGYAIAVIRDGRVVYSRGYGYADLATRRPVNNQTVFGLASLTKTFTALVLLKLVDAGKIDLDAQLGTYMPRIQEPYKSVTIRQLASMTAGVPASVPHEIAWPAQIATLQKLPLVAQPGASYLYSNFSYRLLGTVIQNVTGRPYLQNVRSAILEPLGMSTTGTTAIFWDGGNVATAYGDNMGNGTIRQVDYKDPAISFSAGMLATTIDDLGRYGVGLLQGNMLSRQGYQTLWRQRPPLANGAPSNWAFGWACTNPAWPAFANKTMVAMNGGTAGVASTMMLFPDQNCGLVALCNLRKPQTYAIAKKAAHLLFGAQDQSG